MPFCSGRALRSPPVAQSCLSQADWERLHCLRKRKSNRLIFQMYLVRMGYICCRDKPHISLKGPGRPTQVTSKGSCLSCICSGFQHAGLYNNFVSTNAFVITMTAENRAFQKCNGPYLLPPRSDTGGRSAFIRSLLLKYWQKNSNIYHRIPAISHIED